MSDKKIIKGKSGIAFYEYTSWAHRYKKIDINGKIKLCKKKGFKTEEEAIESYNKYKKEFEEELKKFHITVDKDITIREYLTHWFDNIYSERIESKTKMVGLYILNSLILPNIEYDIKVSLTTKEYLDDILEKRKILKLSKDTFLKDAIIFKNLSSTKVSLNSYSNGKILDFCFKDFPFLAFWSKVNAPFVCIEPWYTTADNYDNCEVNYCNKENMLHLKVGEKFNCGYTIKFN